MLIAGLHGALGWQGSLSVQAKAMNGTERNRVFLTAVAAAEDGMFSLGTYLTLAFTCPESACQQA